MAGRTIGMIKSVFCNPLQLLSFMKNCPKVSFSRISCLLVLFTHCLATDTADVFSMFVFQDNQVKADVIRLFLVAKRIFGRADSSQLHKLFCTRVFRHLFYCHSVHAYCQQNQSKNFIAFC